MIRWTHPDRLDRLTSGSNATPSAGAATPGDVADVLARALVTGALRRIPRKPAHRDIVLAVIGTGMRRRHPYTELELNEFLKGRLAAMNAEVDHVTCRRLMVDVGILKRDRAGARYFVNQQRIRTILAEDSAAAVDELLRQALEERRR